MCLCGSLTAFNRQSIKQEDEPHRATFGIRQNKITFQILRADLESGPSISVSFNPEGTQVLDQHCSPERLDEHKPWGDHNNRQRNDVITDGGGSQGSLGNTCILRTHRRWASAAQRGPLSHIPTITCCMAGRPQSQQRAVGEVGQRRAHQTVMSNPTHFTPYGL